MQVACFRGKRNKCNPMGLNGVGEVLILAKDLHFDHLSLTAFRGLAKHAEAVHIAETPPVIASLAAAG